MEMLILKSAACLALLMLFYKLLLEKENMHVFKRFYLLGALLISGAIPFVTFTEYVETAPLLPLTENPLLFTETTSESTSGWVPLLLWTLYFLGVAVFGFIFLRNLFHIIRKIRSNQKIRKGRTATVLLAEDLPPHTFWSYIFLNKQKFEKGQIPKQVYEHEEAHAREKHTLDILFLELLQVFFWFNPLIYLVKRAVKLNHEFLADRAVLESGSNTASYQELLLAFSSNEPQNALINSINYSLIKKRFTVMKTRTSKTTSVLKGLLLLPLLALLLFSFSTRETVLIDAPSVEFQEKVTPEMIREYNVWAKEMIASDSKPVLVEKRNYKRMAAIYRLMTSEQKAQAEDWPENSIEVIEIVEDEQEVPKVIVDEYNELARHFNAMGQEGQVRADRYNRMVYIYERMSPEQKKKAEKFPDINFPPPPPPPAPPAPEEGKIPPPPPPPPAPTVEKALQIAPPPPPPPSPVEGVKKWIEEGAEFFYNGKAITGEELLKIVRKNGGKNLSVQVVTDSSGKTVRISDK